MRTAAFVIAVALLFTGCARVYVPPAIDLKPHEVVGIIKFSSNSKGDLTDYVTQKFIESITEDQEELRVAELGNEKAVLAAIDQADLGPDALKAIGEKYKVASVFIGDLTVSDVKPSCIAGPGFASFEAKVSAKLAVKLVETATGITLWTNSGRDERTVAGVSRFGSDLSFDAEDPDEAYGDLARELCRRVTHDFRHTRRSKCCCHR